MTKPLLAYILGISFVSTGLIPVARNIFSIQVNDAPLFFLAGGIWMLSMVVLLSSSRILKIRFKKN